MIMLELNPGCIAGGAVSKFPAVQETVTGAEGYLDVIISVNIRNTEAAETGM